MTLCRALNLLSLLLFAFMTTLVRADSWTYTSGSNTARDGSSLSVGFQYSAPQRVTDGSRTFSSQLSAGSAGEVSTNVFLAGTGSHIMLNSPHNSEFSSDPFGRAGSREWGTPFASDTRTDQGAVSSTVTPESSSIVLLLGGIVCIFVGARGKAKVG